MGSSEHTVSTSIDQSQQPEDRCWLAYFLLFLEGAGMLFPWNVFITAGGYFSSRFCGTRFADTFDNYFGLAYNLFNVAFLCLALLVQHHFSLQTRVVLPFLLILLGFSLSTILVFHTELEAVLVFWLTLADISVCGLATSFLQGGIFGLVGHLPPLYTQAVMSGQGLSGVTVSLAALLSVWLKPQQTSEEEGCVEYSKVDRSAFLYFLVADVVIVLCVAAHFALLRLPFVQVHLHKVLAEAPAGPINEGIDTPLCPRRPVQPAAAPSSSYASPSYANGSSGPSGHLPPEARAGVAGPVGRRRDQTEEGEAEEEDEGKEEHSPLVRGEDGTGAEEEQEVADGGPARRSLGLLTGGPAVHYLRLQDSEEAAAANARHSSSNPTHSSGPDANSPRPSTADNWQNLWSVGHLLGVLRQVWPLAMAVQFVFIVTISLFPSIASHIEPGSGLGRLSGDLWLPSYFLLFNVFDWAGRSAAGLRCRPTPATLLRLSYLRVCFVPLFLLCYTRGGLQLFEHVFWPVLFMTLFAFSNGYCASLLMMLGPSYAADPDKEAAGTWMVLCLSNGLLLGSLLSFAWLPLR
eukprot:g70479.t1